MTATSPTESTRTVVSRLVAAAALACLLALLTLLTACGSEGGGSALPSADGASTATDSSTDEPSGDPSVDPEDALLKFAQCMREHGVDMPDPGPDGRLMLNGDGTDPEVMEAADEACKELREAAIPEDAQREIPEEEKQAFLDMAQCMRDKGYDFPDPVFEGGGIRQEITPDSGIDPEDPTFQADMDECRDEAGVEPPGEPRKES